jgi:hypothetical protein
LTRDLLVNLVCAHLHADQLGDAAREIALFSDVPRRQADEQPWELINGLFHWSLNNDHYDWAAKMCWGDTLFTPHPYATKLVWDTFKRSSSILLLGAASMSKSYSAGVYLFLDWVRDPEWTTVRVVGPSEAHLKDNLFTHLVTLHQQSVIPLPGFIGDLFIGLDAKARKSSIQGVVIPIGRFGAGKLQGTKRVPRKQPHPVFGPLSRLRIFLDELENISKGVWRDIDNLFSQTSNPESFKIAGACNPADLNGPVAYRAEPIGGWEKGFDIDTSESWKSQRGWDVVRLDAMKCENVLQGKIIYQGLQTKEGVDRILLNSGGVFTPAYYTQVRGAFPPSGTSFSVIAANFLASATGEYIFRHNPERAAGSDSALEGTSAAKFATGRFGLALGIKHPATHEHPDGFEEIFPAPRWGLQVDQLFSLPTAETVRMAGNIKLQCQQIGVKPDWLLLDRTGNGAGVHDLLREIWSPEVRGLNYSEAPTERKIFEEDTQTCKEEYDRVHTELWFALARWLEFGLIKFSPVIDTGKLFSQLSARQYLPGLKKRVESKVDYKARFGGESPDEADAITLLLHAVRLASGVIPGMASAGAAGDADPENDAVPFIIGATELCPSL